MKISELIVLHLAENNSLSLQGIGSFFLDQPAIKEDGLISFPENSIRFQQNTRIGPDELLIERAVSETKKLKSLVTSDIDSFVQLGQQFLHLGKPFDIAGLGSLRRNFKGEIEFLQNSQPSSINEKIPSAVQEKQKTEISFASLPKKKNRIKPIHLLIAVMSLLAIMTIYYFVAGDKKRDDVRINNIDSGIEDKPNSIPTPPTTTNNNVKAPEAAVSDMAEAKGFRVVLKEYNSLSKARFFYDKLKGDHELIVFTRDSVTFKVAVVFDLPLSDSAGVRDSLHRITGLKTYVDLP